MIRLGRRRRVVEFYNILPLRITRELDAELKRADGVPA
jgi:hypothetical protein